MAASATGSWRNTETVKRSPRKPTPTTYTSPNNTSPETDSSEMPEVPMEKQERHSRPVTDLIWDSKQQILFSSSLDKHILKWKLINGKMKVVGTLCGHTGGVWSISLIGSILVSGGADGYIAYWDAEFEGETQKPRQMWSFGGIVKFVRGGESGLCIYNDKLGVNSPACLTFCDPKDPTNLIWQTSDFGEQIKSVCWTPCGLPKIFTGHADGKLKVWGPQPSEEECESPFGFAGYEKKKVCKPRLLVTVQPHNKAINCLNVCNNYLLTASEDGTVKAINCANRDLPAQYVASANRPLRSVAAVDLPKEKCFAFTFAGGREPRHVTTSSLLPDEFEIFQQYCGKQNYKVSSQKAAVGPIHRLLWVEKVEGCLNEDGEVEGRIFSCSEDGDVKAWKYAYGELNQLR